ncbi:Acetyl esterase/lipase [Kytococcus aerolatus]|uniref:Acetyl esterase/lipase n=1 Tax=Kytococcus aerolatus TaxID=592308 RepID=A0A212TGP0_9MICO|nr:alpha/beta hydrolase [Kytococcus aerolatus]SNC64986.1 Acetyl esterase/lipase [Kytococcus aerolatus]
MVTGRRWMVWAAMAGMVTGVAACGEGAADPGDTGAQQTASAAPEEDSPEPSTEGAGSPEDESPTSGDPDGAEDTGRSESASAEQGSPEASSPESGTGEEAQPSTEPSQPVEPTRPSEDPAPATGGEPAGTAEAGNPIPSVAEPTTPGEAAPSDAATTTDGPTTETPGSTPAETSGSAPPEDAPAAWSDWRRYGSAEKQRYSILPGEPGRGVVVAIHGGGWVGGDAEMFMDPSSRKNTLVQRLHDEGWWVASLEYRRAHKAPWPATPDDVHAGVAHAVATARAQGAADGVVLFGDSAGAHLAVLEAVTHPGTADAVVGYFGIYNAETAQEQRAPMDCPDGKAAEDNILMHDATDPAVAGQIRAASPVNRVSAGAPPVYLLHGDADCTAPYQQSLEMRDALRAAGAEARTVVVPGAVHSQPAFWTDEQFVGPVVDFMRTRGGL